MNNINSSSLFHFTRKFDTLQRIIRTGLRYSFAYEQYPKELVQANLYPDKDINDSIITSNGVAIPMISFCDISITRAKQHIEKYGKYMIGFDKTAFSKDFENLINPVIYVHSPNLKDAIINYGMENAKAYCELLQLITNKDSVSEFVNRTSHGLLPSNQFIKKIDPLIEKRFLSNFLMGLVKPISDEIYYYYDEREWRLFMPSNVNGIDWKWGITKEEYQQNKDAWNDDIESYENMHIKIPWECYDEYITHIVVSEEKEIDELIEQIMDDDIVFGYENDMDYSRMKLISKITSFERIEKDF